jgi:hypothetical protein
MLHRLAISTLLITALYAALAPDLSLAQTGQAHSSLRLRQWSTHQDSKGQRYLTVDFGNYGDKAVTVHGMCPGGDRWFNTIDRTLDAGTTAKWTIQLPGNDPAYVTLDTSEGKFRFDLDTSN